MQTHTSTESLILDKQRMQAMAVYIYSLETALERVMPGLLEELQAMAADTVVELWRAEQDG